MGVADKSVTAVIASVLPGSTKRALDLLSQQSWLKRSEWYLAGGTALAMKLGHRRSVDLDFFTPQAAFSQARLLKRFESLDWVTDIVREGTVYGRLCGAKVSFIAYPFFVRKASTQWYGSVRILSPQDIAVMKIIAISQRGRKRDFIDLYWYVKHTESLKDVLQRLPEQYPTVAHNYHHILKSLLYFTDAEADRMPIMTVPLSWKTVKGYFQREIPLLMKELVF